MVFFLKEPKENMKGGETFTEARFLCFFRERGSDFSLRSRPIRSSDFLRPRRKVALRGKNYAWASVWGSFYKLREVGVLSYLLYLLFKFFVDG